MATIDRRVQGWLGGCYFGFMPRFLDTFIANIFFIINVSGPPRWLDTDSSSSGPIMNTEDVIRIEY